MTWGESPPKSLISKDRVKGGKSAANNLGYTLIESAIGRWKSISSQRRPTAVAQSLCGYKLLAALKCV
jgi:hypothetical protein